VRGALRELRSLGEQRNIDGMARYGFAAKVVYGVCKAKMDLLGGAEIGPDHELALSCGAREYTTRGFWRE